MAGASRIITLDVGTCTAKLAEFQVAGNGQLTLLRFGVRELGLDPNKEENRFPAVAEAVKTLLGEMGVKPGPAIVSISGQSVFVRFVKLPPVDAVQIEQLIGFEAQQNVPFPIHEVVWDYQMMPGRSSTGEAEAIIVAMKADVLESESRAAEMAGLKVKLIDVSPLALYNAYRYNYGLSSETTLLIDMGARTTNLLFIEGGHLYTRGIPIAGNLLSQNICNELQEPFAAAETLKKGKGFVHLGGAYADPDDRDAARISKLIRTTFTRLHNELMRSISFYRTQQGGTAPKRVLLTGGTCQLPYADVFIGEKLNLPVEYFNPFRNVTIAPGLDLEKLSGESCYAAELVGLATREAGACPVEISLIPPELKEKQEKARKQPMLLGALAAWAVLMLLLSASNLRQAAIADERAVEIRQAASNFQRYEAKVKEEAKVAEAANEQYEAAKKLVHQRDAWRELLDSLNGAVPNGVWVTRMIPSYDGNPLGMPLPQIAGGAPPPAGGQGEARIAPEVNRLTLRGLFHANAQTLPLTIEIVNEFKNRLIALPWVDAEKTEVESTMAPGDQLALNFSIILHLKEPIQVTP